MVIFSDCYKRMVEVMGKFKTKLVFFLINTLICMNVKVLFEAFIFAFTNFAVVMYLKIKCEKFVY